jgi:hypothetical protein
MEAANSLTDASVNFIDISLRQCHSRLFQNQ